MIVWALIAGLLLSAGATVAQTVPPAQSQTDALHDTSPPSPPAAAPTALKPLVPSSAASDSDLPDAPGAVITQQQDAVAAAKASLKASGREQKPCNFFAAAGLIAFDPNKIDLPRPRCAELIYPYQRFLSTNIAIPLTWKEKGYLAVHFTTDPAALGTIVGISAINIAIDSHTAYGPGFKGFAELAGVSVLQNATAEAVGTFAVPSLMHQDPRYYRMTNKPFVKRFLYSVSRSYVSRSDDGRTIPNYGTLAAYPVVAELSNLYVPGIESDGASTAERIVTGLAFDPVNNLVNEFLPDVAKRIHVRIIFVQQIMNNLATSNSGVM